MASRSTDPAQPQRPDRARRVRNAKRTSSATMSTRGADPSGPSGVLVHRGDLGPNDLSDAPSVRFVMGGPRARKDEPADDEEAFSDSDAELAAHNIGSKPGSDKEDDDVSMSPSASPSPSPSPSAASAARHNGSPNRTTSGATRETPNSPSSAVPTRPTSTTTTTTLTAKDADGDAQMKEVTPITPSAAVIPPSAASSGKNSKSSRAHVTGSPSPSDGDTTMYPIPRKAIPIPPLPAKPPRTMLEDLQPYRRPVLRTEERVQETRVVRVVPTINEEVYPEQLIDPTKCRRATYVPVVQPQQHGLMGTMTSPHIGARQMSTMGGGGAYSAAASSSASSHLPPRTPGTAARAMPGVRGARVGGGSGANALPPAALSTSTNPASPPPRSGALGGAAPSTPHQSSQLGGRLQLTWSIPPQVKVKHLSQIVTQTIPYGRIDIKPTGHSQLIASSVPRAALLNGGGLGSLYLPPSRSATVYITLNLPGHIDYEIRLDNLFVLPDQVDFERLKVQQRAIYAAEVDTKTGALRLPAPAASAQQQQQQQQQLLRASPPAGLVSVKDEKPANKRSLSNSMMATLPTHPQPQQHVAHNNNSHLAVIPFRLPMSAHQQHQQAASSASNGKSTLRPSSVVRRPPPSVRVGGHLERKRKFLTLAQQMERMESTTMAETDTVPTEATADASGATTFVAPTLKDVLVSIRTKGRALVPVPAHTEMRPVYGEAIMAPKRGAVPTPNTNAVATPTVTVKKEGQPSTAASPPPPPPSSTPIVKTEVKTELNKADAKTGDAPSTVAPASSKFLYLPPAVVAHTSVWVPRCPSTLSAANPRIEFEHGEIVLERMVPRLGGWVVRGGLTMEAARNYKQVGTTPPTSTETPALPTVKLEPPTPAASTNTAAASAATAAIKRGFLDTAPIDRRTLELELDQAGLKEHVSRFRKLRPVDNSDEDEPMAQAEAVSPAKANDERKDQDATMEDVVVKIEPAQASTVKTEQAQASSTPSPLLNSQWHDVAEVGDRIRFRINAPTPPVQAKSKPILPMQYELIIEGLRIAPYQAAPEFPATVDLYRLGTAPKEAVEAEALQTRLTASVVPSKRLVGLCETHWTEEGRPESVHVPLLVPSSFLPMTSSEDEEDSSSSSEDEAEEAKKDPADRKKVRAPPLPSPSTTKQAYQARGKLFEDLPQHNWEEYFQLRKDDALEAEIDSENEALENYPSGGDDSASDGDGSDGDSYSGSSESDWDTDEREAMAGGAGDASDDGRSIGSDDHEERRIGSRRSGAAIPPGSGGKGSALAGGRFTSKGASTARPSGAGTFAGKALPFSSKQKSTSGGGGGGGGGSSSASSRSGGDGGGGGGLGKKSSSSSSYDGDLGSHAADSGQSEAVWVACDKCGKWRKMPAGTDADSLPTVWYCRMNPDATHNLCAHPEEEDPDAHTANFSDDGPTTTSSSGGGASAGGAAGKSDASKKKPTGGDGSSSSAQDKDAQMSRAEKLKAEQAAAAAQAAHMALLAPNPRIPTIEDVCFACDQPLLLPAGEGESRPNRSPAEVQAENARVRQEEVTLFCHGPCNRMWHRKCAKIDPKHQSHTPIPTPPLVGKEPAPQPGVPHTSTHVVAFKPLESPYWFCSDCMALTSTCFVCFQPGTIDPTLSRIVLDAAASSRRSANPNFLMQCPYQGGCGKFYHERCLFEQPRTMSHKGSRGQAKTGDLPATTPNLVPRPKAPLICALHTCVTCGGAGTTSTNLRDIGRTLVQCVHCPSSVHWQVKCHSTDGDFHILTRKCGECDRHRDPKKNDESEEDEDDFEPTEVKQRRRAAQANVQLTFGKAPQHLFGSEPQPESESDEDGEDDDDEPEEDDEPANKRPARPTTTA